MHCTTVGKTTDEKVETAVEIAENLVERSVVNLMAGNTESSAENLTDLHPDSQCWCVIYTSDVLCVILCAISAFFDDCHTKMGLFQKKVSIYSMLSFFLIFRPSIGWSILNIVFWD